ncbi:MAG: protein TolQ [Aliidongia sp.]|jgi:biopolymer transport protein TolQ
MQDAVTLGSQAASSFSTWSLFLQADLIVKCVMLVLLAASLWSWGIIFAKIMTVKRLSSDANKFEENFWSGGSIDELYDRIANRPADPMAATFAAAMLEWRRSAARGLIVSGGLQISLKERIERLMAVTTMREMERVERYMTFLATVGSTAPFVGLFGTVWGIMNAFEGIAASKNTSLAVVAPGIAEALFTTAMGLIAAIPAVIGYNKITTDLGRYSNRLENFAGEFSAILSRQLEEKV